MNHSQIPLVWNQWNAAGTDGVVESDEIGGEFSCEQSNCMSLPL